MKDKLFNDLLASAEEMVSLEKGKKMSNLTGKTIVFDTFQRATISLEPEFWEIIEKDSGGDVAGWVNEKLKGKKRGYSRSSWLRICAANVQKESGPNPKAPRKFKSLTLPMNEYEYTRLVAGAESADRGLLDFVRQAVKNEIQEFVG